VLGSTPQLRDRSSGLTVTIGASALETIRNEIWVHSRAIEEELFETGGGIFGPPLHGWDKQANIEIANVAATSRGRGTVTIAYGRIEAAEAWIVANGSHLRRLGDWHVHPRCPAGHCGEPSDTDAVRRGAINSNPFAVLTDDDRPDRGEQAAAHEWTDEELAALFSASETLAAKRESRYDYTPLLRLVATLGLRKGEALGLRWEDFDKDAGVLHVRRQWLVSGEYGPPKTKAGTRRIALPADLRDLLIGLRLRSDWSPDEHPIFASLAGTPLGHRNVLRRGWEPARDLAGLQSSLTLHDLRHAAASRLINARLDPVTVAAVLGHEDATVTLKVYGHLWDCQRTDDDVRKALAGGAARGEASPYGGFHLHRGLAPSCWSWRTYRCGRPAIAGLRPTGVSLCELRVRAEVGRAVGGCVLDGHDHPVDSVWVGVGERGSHPVLRAQVLHVAGSRFSCWGGWCRRRRTSEAESDQSRRDRCESLHYRPPFGSRTPATRAKVLERRMSQRGR
jgi:site-specific recombinase XerC